MFEISPKARTLNKQDLNNVWYIDLLSHNATITFEFFRLCKTVQGKPLHSNLRMSAIMPYTSIQNCVRVFNVSNVTKQKLAPSSCDIATVDRLRNSN